LRLREFIVERIIAIEFGDSSKIKPRLRAEWEVLSEELCILASWFSPIRKEFIVRGVKSKKISGHPGRDLSKSFLKVRNVRVKVECAWLETEEELIVICTV